MSQECFIGFEAGTAVLLEDQLMSCWWTKSPEVQSPLC